MNPLRRSGRPLSGGSPAEIAAALPSVRPGTGGEAAPAAAVRALARSIEPPPAATSPDRLLFRVAGGHQFFAPEEISWVEAQGAAVRLCALGECHEVRESLRVLEQRLDPRGFVRVHRSFLVSIRGIRKVTVEPHGDRLLHMVDGARIRLSRSHRATLEARLGGVRL